MNRGWMTCSVALLIALTLAPLARARSAEPTPRDFATPLVFTQLPASIALPAGATPRERMLRAEWGEGSRVVRRDADGSLTVLTEGFAGACEPDVFFDGTRILFAGKRAAGDPWNVFEMNADGTGLRQITRDVGNCRQPVFLTTIFTIVDTESAFQIAFVSDVAGERNEAGTGMATNLYSCRMDGGGLRRLTHNVSDDFDPFLLSDGRLICASWQRMDLRRGPLGRISIGVLNVDGADYTLFCVARDDTLVRHMACETRSGEVIFVEGERGIAGDGAGRLAAVTVRRPFHSYRVLDGQDGWLFHSPSPFADGTLLVARRPADGSGTLGLVRLDPATGDATPLFDDPDHHDFHARALAPRVRPDGRSSVVAEKYPTGKLYCLDVHLTDPATDPPLAAGTVRGVRIIEGVPARAGSAEPYVARRVLGEVAVEPDGSFQVEIPASVPIQLQTLDENGMALFTCGWTWAKNREWRGCIGCHEDPELVPENRLFDAVVKPATVLLAPPEERRTVTFARDVMPIVEAKCTSCHDGDTHPLELTGESDGTFNRAFLSLMQPAAADPDGDSGAGRYVHPGRARTSPLVWTLFGRNTSRPWDATHGVEVRIERHMPGEGELSEEERKMIVEWVDLGAQWDDSPGTPAAGTDGEAGGQ